MPINYIFIISALTITITRIWLWIFPKHGPMVLGFRPHHYVYGLVLAAIYFLLPKSISYKYVLLAIGLGLVVDEIPLFFIFKGWSWPENHWKQYHSWESILGIVLIFLVCYLIIRFH